MREIESKRTRICCRFKKTWRQLIAICGTTEKVKLFVDNSRQSGQKFPKKYRVDREHSACALDLSIAIYLTGIFSIVYALLVSPQRWKWDRRSDDNREIAFLEDMETATRVNTPAVRSEITSPQVTFARKNRYCDVYYALFYFLKPIILNKWTCA
jgi:hypothetical protein